MGAISIPLMSEFFWPLNKINLLSDFVDKCHYSFTIGLLMFFALVTASTQIVGNYINCMLPAEFPDTWKDYVHSFCFITQTYVKDNSVVYPDGVEPRHININYYQWVPYVLVVQGLLFYLPHWFWMAMAKTSDVDFDFVVNESLNARANHPIERKKILAEIATKIHKTLNIGNKSSRGLGSFSTKCYILAKLLNICNVLFQLMMINNIVGYGHNDWGFTLIRSPMDPMQWNTTNYFPRIAYCTFTQDYHGQVNTREVQCALLSNFYNEKIYLVLYFWLILLAAFTIFNLLYVTYYLITSYIVHSFRRRFMKVYYLSEGKISAKFISEVLGFDGLFLLYFIELNAGSLIASEVVNALHRAHRGCAEDDSEVDTRIELSEVCSLGDDDGKIHGHPERNNCRKVGIGCDKNGNSL